MNQFVETKKRFESAINGTFPMSFAAWMQLPDSHKAGALFVNFYDQIITAWAHCEVPFVDEEDGVSTVLQYLIKNVPILKENPKRYTPGYMYRVAYNCMGRLKYIERDIKRFQNTTSNVIVSGDDELDLFDTIPMNSDILHTIGVNNFSRDLWNAVKHMDRDTIAFIDHIMFGAKLRAGVEKKQDVILKELRAIFKEHGAEPKPSKKKNTFADVLAFGNSVASANVIMPDGTEAIYFGEYTVTRSDDGTLVTKYVFFGPVMDYMVSEEIAKTLEVTCVEF